MNSSNYTSARCPRRTALRKAVALWLVVAFALVSAQAQVREGDDLYLESFHLIQQGDGFLKAGNKKAALAKYQQAESGLQEFRKAYPDLGLKMVSFRLNYLAERSAECSDKPAASPDTTAAPVTSATPAASPLKLLAPGGDPKTVLRLHPKAGDQQKLTTTLKMAMDMQLGGQNQAIKIPAIQMTMDVTVKSVTETGDIAYETVMGDPTVAEESGGGQVSDAIKASLAGLKGLTGSGSMSSRGLVKSIDIKLPAGADPQARQAMEQMKESLAQMAIPFPEEAVGSGAKWEVARSIKSQGMTLNQTTTYELVSVDGDHIAAKSTVVQTAANQKIQNPAMPGMALDLLKMNGRGSGELKMDLAQLLPVEAAMDSHSEFSMGMNVGGQKQNMEMKIDLNLRLESK